VPWARAIHLMTRRVAPIAPPLDAGSVEWRHNRTLASWVTIERRHSGLPGAFHRSIPECVACDDAGADVSGGVGIRIEPRPT
jgi:hypothetical protein